MVRRADFDQEVLISHRRIGAQCVADPGGATSEEAKADGMAEFGGIGDGCHPAEIVVHVIGGVNVQKMRARRQCLAAIHGPKADKAEIIIAH